MELRYDTAALAPYEAESDECGRVAGALRIILCLSRLRHDDMKRWGGSSSNRSIQLDPELVRCFVQRCAV